MSINESVSVTDAFKVKLSKKLKNDKNKMKLKTFQIAKVNISNKHNEDFVINDNSRLSRLDLIKNSTGILFNVFPNNQKCYF